MKKAGKRDISRPCARIIMPHASVISYSKPKILMDKEANLNSS